jgi:flagellar hook assembly protein FlgD
MATRSISFVVGQVGLATLVADKWPACNNGTVSFDLQSSMSLAPEVTVRVTDATGRLVWKTTTSSFPVEWDMRDNSGNILPAGLYRYYGTYNNGTSYGGTPISRLIVIDPVKTAVTESDK